MRPLLKVLVRAKKDRDAVEAAVDTFYRRYGWEDQVAVGSIGGSRDPQEVIERLREEARSFDGLVVFLYARELRELLQHEHELPPNVALSFVDKSKVRNARLHEIYMAIEEGKAKFRLLVFWDDARRAHAHLRGPAPRLRIPIKIFHDLYYAVGEMHRELLEEIFEIKVGANPLIVKLEHGVHEIFQGPEPAARVMIPDIGEPRLIGELGAEPVDHDLRACAEASRPALGLMERFARLVFERAAEGYEYDRVIVPWSGGKDSTCALVLALLHFRREDVVPIYVDTGIDFPENLEYIDRVARMLGVSYEVAEAEVADEIERRGLPSLEDRWCTRLKIAALYRKISELADRPLIIVGDRDSESALRLRRPFVREHEGFVQAAPLKVWSAALAQLFLVDRGVPLNPLYERGFYRLGCLICPAFRSWELLVMDRLLAKGVSWGSSVGPRAPAG